MFLSVDIKKKNFVHYDSSLLILVRVPPRCAPCGSSAARRDKGGTRAMGATQNPRGPRSGSPSSGSTSGGTDGPERAAEPTPLAGALAGARALPRCLLICHLGRREIRESPTGRLLTASSPAPMCRQHCDTERVRKIRREGICSQRAARPRRVDNTATLRESERSNGKGCAHSEQPGPQVSPASG